MTFASKEENKIKCLVKIPKPPVALFVNFALFEESIWYRIIVGWRGGYRVGTLDILIYLRCKEKMLRTNFPSNRHWESVDLAFIWYQQYQYWTNSFRTMQRGRFTYYLLTFLLYCDFSMLFSTKTAGQKKWIALKLAGLDQYNARLLKSATNKAW